MNESTTRAQDSYWTYSTVKSYFLQDEDETDPAKFDYVAADFGLIDRTYDLDEEDEEDDNDGDHEYLEKQKRPCTQWARFKRHVHMLNSCAERNVQYRVLYLGRHGEGFHNVAESWYGTEAWDCYWSLQDGNESYVWSDARLTEVGQAQARTAHNAWQKQITKDIPFPEMFYVSPLNRCLETAFITFNGLDKDIVRPFRPIVKEMVRETLGIHTCDCRSSKTVIQAEYPEYIIEDGFSEEDPLWDANYRESNSSQNARIKTFLDDIFTAHENNSHNNKNNVQFISVTTHSGAITSILDVVGHRRFDLQTGAVIPVLVRAERVPGKEPERLIDPPTGVPKCKCDPLSAGPLQVRMVNI